MTNEFWQKLFSGFRLEDQKLLVILTSSGVQVSVQNLARIEEELILVRGRISGTPDNGRLFLLPYDQVSTVYVNRMVILEEVELFSPTVTPERKLEVARMVAEVERRAREDAKNAESAAKGGQGGSVDDAFKRLEALRAETKAEHAAAAAMENADAVKTAQTLGLPSPRAAPTTARPMPGLPSRPAPPVRQPPNDRNRESS